MQTLNEDVIGILPEALKSPHTYIILVFIVTVITLVAIIKQRNITISIAGKKLLDISGANKESCKNDKEGSSSKKRGDGGTPHVGCHHVNDFILIIAETTSVTSEIAEIKYKTRLSEQMFKCNQHLLRLRSIYQNTYRARMSNNMDADVCLKSYKFYQALTKIMIEDLEDLVIRVAFLNNHLTQYKDDKVYDAYIEGQYKAVRDMVNNIVTDMYFGDWPVGQREVLQIHQDLEGELKSIVWSIFTDGRNIAFRYETKIEQMEKNFKDFVRKIVGINDETLS